MRVARCRTCLNELTGGRERLPMLELALTVGLALGGILLGAGSLWIFIEGVVLEYMDSPDEIIALFCLPIAAMACIFPLRSCLVRQEVLTGVCFTCGHRAACSPEGAGIAFPLLGVPGLVAAIICVFALTEVDWTGKYGVQGPMFLIGGLLIGLSVFGLTLRLLIHALSMEDVRDGT